MKTLNLYVAKNFLLTLLVTTSLLVFVLMLRSLNDVYEILLQGMPASVIFKVLIYALPLTLTMAIPCATLIAVILVFGQMSANNEITAMRASGVSVLQIIAPVLIIVFILTCLCLQLQLDTAPKLAWKIETLRKSSGGENIMAGFKEGGVQNDFNEMRLFIDKKGEDNSIKGIEIFKMGEKKKITQHIKAKSGKLVYNKENGVIDVILYNAAVESYDKDTGRERRSFSSSMSFPVDFNNKFNEKNLLKRVRRMSFSEVYGQIILEKKRNLDTTRLEVELNKRIALALSPIAFVLIGIPLSIRISRKENSVGVFISIILIAVYFAFVYICDSLYSRPELQPQLLLWIPSVCYQVVGIFLIYKITKR